MVQKKTLTGLRPLLLCVRTFKILCQQAICVCDLSLAKHSAAFECPLALARVLLFRFFGRGGILCAEWVGKDLLLLFTF